MVNLIITFLAALAGYITTVACALAGTMALTGAAPQMVVAHHRVRPGYKMLHQVLWLVCVVLGAFVTARVGMHINQTQQEAALAGVLLAVLWFNTWEARQRGTPFQILMSLVTLAGVAVGFALENRLIHK